MVGEKLAASLMGDGEKHPHILCLYGELGSGKTTFTQGFAKGLGLSSRLLSPTFIIVRRYLLPATQSFFYHVDLYRTKSEQDIKGLGLTEILSDPSAIVLIEWAERLGTFLPKNRTDVAFEVVNENERTIKVRSEHSENSEDSENQKT